MLTTTAFIVCLFTQPAPAASPTRAELLTRFDALRTELASADLATLARAVDALERLRAPATGHREREREHGRDHGRDHHANADCMDHLTTRFVAEQRGLTWAIDQARAACAGADAPLLEALTDRFVGEQRGLVWAVTQARTVAADPALAGLGSAFAPVLDAFVREQRGLTWAVTQTTDTLRGLGPGGARCIVRLLPRLEAEQRGLTWAAAQARKACGPQ